MPKKKQTTKPKAKSGLRKVNHVAIVLDSSGSMASLSQQARNHFNEQLQAIRKSAADMSTDVTLTVFSSVSEFIRKGADISTVADLAPHEYVPSGMTALYDAIGTTIEYLKTMQDRDADVSYLVAVITDGEENFSKEYHGEEGRKRLKTVIDDLTKKGNWTFAFLAANIDAAQTATSIGISAANSRNFEATVSGATTANTMAASAMCSFMSARSAGETSVSNFYAASDKQPSESGKAKKTKRSRV